MRCCCEDLVEDRITELETDSMKHFIDLLLRPFLREGEGSDRHVSEGGRVDEVLCWHVIAVILRVSQRASIIRKRGNVIANAWYSVGAVL